MSFFDRQLPLFDVKKKLGITNIQTTASSALPPSLSSAFNSPLQAQTSADDIESQTGGESWVELAPSRASLCSSVEAILIDRDGSEQHAKDSRASPISFQSPHVEMETNLEQVKSRLVKDMLPPGKTDWIWDWSARPESLVSQSRSLRNRGNVESNLTTPPNSPEPSEFEYNLCKNWPNFWRLEVIVSLVVSNLMTFFLGATVGYCICKRISKHRHNF